MTTEKQIVETRDVSCSGNEGADGHPKVYLSIKPDETYIVCPYCSKEFHLKAN